MRPEARTRPPRVAIGGFFLECNRWSPSTGAAGFADGIDLAGEALAQELRRRPARLLGEATGFVDEMDRRGDWTPVPLRLAAAWPSGPVEHAFFLALQDEMLQRLREAGPLDGVFMALHGAALTTELDDPEGQLLTRMRALLGPEVPMVAVLDLHTNVAPSVTEALNALVAYRTNPHVDLPERGAEAAALLHRFWADGPGEVVLQKLPLVPPATSLLTAPGQAYERLIAQGQAQVGGDVLNVSLCGGFALADSVHGGFSVVVTTRRGAAATGRALARQLAQQVWDGRAAFQTRLTPLADAVHAALQARALGQRLILADVADNPGGGGGGNTVTLLRALLQADAQDVVLGVFTDPALAAQAHALGVGAVWEAGFNRQPDTAFAEPLTHRATVLALSDGHFVGERGMARGVAQRMGPSALLQVGGVRVAVVSLRQQLLDPAQLKALGEDLSQAWVLVAKSRGHFRAGFDTFAPPERILEVDAPGLTTPNLAQLPWQRLPRPVYPIDPETAWSPDPLG